MENMEQIRECLWNPKSEESSEDRLLEQYKLYVEMADRISQRRGATNTFFLTFNTAIVGTLAGFFDKVPTQISVPVSVAVRHSTAIATVADAVHPFPSLMPPRTYPVGLSLVPPRVW